MIFIFIADGRTDQPKVVQEVLTDLKTKQQDKFKENNPNPICTQALGTRDGFGTATCPLSIHILYRLHIPLWACSHSGLARTLKELSAQFGFDFKKEVF